MLLTQVPISTLTTLYAKLVIPIKRANIVPSIIFGVTFAYKDIAGMKLSDRTSEPKAHSDKKYDTESLMPILRLNL